ncbi:hypothetical protein ACVWYS_002161 [Arthrobacter sp. TE12231]
MRGNPTIGQASTHPYQRSGPITDVPRLGHSQPDAEQRGQQPDAGRAWPPSTSALGLEELAAELAGFLGRRQRPGLNRPPSATGLRSSVQDSGVWRDQLLAEIEDLARDLKRKVARYASLRAAHSGASTAPADAAAVTCIHQALEDIAATALGVETALRELFLRAGMNAGRALKVGTAQE